MSDILAIGFAEPRLVTCRVCLGTGRGRVTLSCDACNGMGGYEVDDPCLATLSHNLAVAGGLCESFERGSQYRMRMMLALPEDGDWKPGCKRSAP